MKASRKISIIGCILLFSLSVWAQGSRCTLSGDNTPEIRGFKLGMSLKEIHKRHPDFKIPQADENGYARLQYNVSYLQSYGETSLINEADRKGMDSIKLAFLDGRIVKLQIRYDNSVKWNTVDEFLNKLEMSLNLPDASQWEHTDDRTRLLSCSDVKVQVALEYRPDGGSITIVKDGIEQIIYKRQQKAKDNQKQQFKP